MEYTAEWLKWALEGRTPGDWNGLGNANGEWTISAFYNHDIIDIAHVYQNDNFLHNSGLMLHAPKLAETLITALDRIAELEATIARYEVVIEKFEVRVKDLE